MRSQPDLALQRREHDEPVSGGDRLCDVISGIVVMLFVIAVGFWCAGIVG